MSQKTTLRLPFNGQWFVMNGGDTLEINHHHQNKAQKYAFDFTRIDSNGHSFQHEGKANADYYAFGQPILAPADGTIVEAVDGVRDNTPGQGNYLAAAGNHVIIRHQANEYSFIAHLKQGSVAVKPGGKVKTGQLIGLCGNSGVCFAPHMHFHVQNTVLLDQYKITYKSADLRKAALPIIDIEDYVAEGIKVYFSDVVGQSKPYSPVRGDIVSSTAPTS